MLQSGTMEADGPVDEVIHCYRQSMLGTGEEESLQWNWPEAQDAAFRIPSIRVLDQNGNTPLELKTWDSATFEITIQSKQQINDGGLELAFDSEEDGTRLLKVSTKPFGNFDMAFPAGKPVTLRVHFPNFPLGAGNFRVMAGITKPLKGFLTDGMVNMGTLKVSEAMVFGGNRPLVARQSYFTCPHQWSLD
jgi:hypothetical protein